MSESEWDRNATRRALWEQLTGHEHDNEPFVPTAWLDQLPVELQQEVLLRIDDQHKFLTKLTLTSKSATNNKWNLADTLLVGSRDQAKRAALYSALIEQDQLPAATHLVFNAPETPVDNLVALDFILSFCNNIKRITIHLYQFDHLVWIGALITKEPLIASVVRIDFEVLISSDRIDIARSLFFTTLLPSFKKNIRTLVIRECESDESDEPELILRSINFESLNLSPSPSLQSVCIPFSDELNELVRVDFDKCIAFVRAALPAGFNLDRVFVSEPQQRAIDPLWWKFLLALNNPNVAPALFKRALDTIRDFNARLDENSPTLLHAFMDYCADAEIGESDLSMLRRLLQRGADPLTTLYDYSGGWDLSGVCKHSRMNFINRAIVAKMDEFVQVTLECMRAPRQNQPPAPRRSVDTYRDAITGLTSLHLALAYSTAETVQNVLEHFYQENLLEAMLEHTINNWDESPVQFALRQKAIPCYNMVALFEFCDAHHIFAGADIPGFFDLFLKLVSNKRKSTEMASVLNRRLTRICGWITERIGGLANFLHETHIEFVELLCYLIDGGIHLDFIDFLVRCARNEEQAILEPNDYNSIEEMLGEPICKLIATTKELMRYTHITGAIEHLITRHNASLEVTDDACRSALANAAVYCPDLVPNLLRWGASPSWLSNLTDDESALSLLCQHETVADFEILRECILTMFQALLDAGQLDAAFGGLACMVPSKLVSAGLRLGQRATFLKCTAIYIKFITKKALALGDKLSEQSLGFLVCIFASMQPHARTISSDALITVLRALLAKMRFPTLCRARPGGPHVLSLIVSDCIFKDSLEDPVTGWLMQYIFDARDRLLVMNDFVEAANILLEDTKEPHVYCWRHTLLHQLFTAFLLSSEELSQLDSELQADLPHLLQFSPMLANWPDNSKIDYFVPFLHALKLVRVFVNSEEDRDRIKQFIHRCLDPYPRPKNLDMLLKRLGSMSLEYLSEDKPNSRPYVYLALTGINPDCSAEKFKKIEACIRLLLDHGALAAYAGREYPTALAYFHHQLGRSAVKPYEKTLETLLVDSLEFADIEDAGYDNSADDVAVEEAVEDEAGEVDD